MKVFSPSFNGSYLVTGLVLILLLGGVAVSQAPWRPIIQAELDMKAPLVEPDADAEAIFWDVTLDDQKKKKLFYSHYVRVKIFTERGRERFSKFDIPYYRDNLVEDVAARVIKPDGTIIELKPGDILERDIVRSGKEVVRAKSFAVPGIEPGVIVEYQYKETLKNDSVNNERLYFQRDIPIQKVTYAIRPYNKQPLVFAFQNMPTLRMPLNDDGFYVGTRENVPAFREEPQMPPESEVRQWAFVNYDSYYGFRWSAFGYYWSKIFDEAIEPNDEIQRKAQELTNGSASPEDKLKSIYDFVQKRIRNASFDQTITPKQREDLKNKKASDTLKRGLGTQVDLDRLFASLAKAAGFEVNVMYSGNRDVSFFNHEKDLNPNYIHHSGIAVRLDNIWKPFNPGVPYMPFGLTFPHDEIISTMIVGGGGFNWIRLPVVDHVRNVTKRSAKLKLLDDGTLEGMVRIEHHGHSATIRRNDLFLRTPAERDERLTAIWKASLNNAEVTEVSIENFSDSSQPYSYSFKVKVPNYAQKTGKRLFIQPGFFEHSSRPLFSSDIRRYSIYFSHPWSEEDETEIEFPKGYEPDNFETPGTVLESSGLGAVRFSLSSEPQSNVLKYKRSFYFGGKGKIIFPASAYKPLKVLFDGFHKADTQSVSLKQKQ